MWVCGRRRKYTAIPESYSSALGSSTGLKPRCFIHRCCGPDLYHCAEYGDFLLYFSRLTHHKRQWLAIESLKYTKTAVKLVIAGPPEPSCEPYVEELRLLIQKYKLTNRVVLLPKWVPEVEKVDLYATCLAAIYFPL